MKLLAVVIMAFVVLSCGGTPTPSPSAPSPTPAPLPAPAPIPIPGAIPAPPRTLTLSGVISDGLDGSPLSLVAVTINGATVATTDGNGRYSATTTLSSRDQFSLQFSRAGFTAERTFYFPVNLEDATKIDWMLTRPCASNFLMGELRAIVQRDYVDFVWDPPASLYPGLLAPRARDYLVEVGGPSLQLSDFTPANVLSTFTGGAMRYRWNTPSAGLVHYWVRVRGKNDCGLSHAPYPVWFDLPR